MFSITNNDKIDFFRVYLDRHYGREQFTLVILCIMASLLVFVTAKKAYKAIIEYNKLQKEGILTTAYVSDIAFGGGRMGSNFVYYQFYDLNNRLVKKKNKWVEKYKGNY